MSSEPNPESATIEQLSRLNVVQDVCNGRRDGVEENIKTGVTIDMLEALGWDTRTQMDFEHNVGPKSADIALIKNGNTKVIVETKSLEKKLEKHKSQGLEYARKEGIVWALLTNGINTQLYKSTIEGVPDSENEPIFETTLQELPSKFSRLYELIGEQHIGDIEEKAGDAVEYIKQKISEKEFLDQLINSKQDLFFSLREEFDERYGQDNVFTKHIDEWIENNEYDTDWDWQRRFRNDSAFASYIQRIVSDAGLKATKTALQNSSGKYGSDKNYREQVNHVLLSQGIPLDWKDQLCNQGAYSFVNRVLFLRMYEDRVDASDKRMDENWLAMLNRSSDVEETIQLLNLVFRQIRKQFAGMYNRPLFDGIHLEEINWDADVVHSIVERTQQHDFSSVGADILGEVYQNHIPKEVRKAIGQFYTSPSIVRYMVDRVEHRLDERSKVMDPACGSGTFLIELYAVLRDKLENEGGWGPESAHRHIVSEMLYGSDIDDFATQLTTMNLLLRDLDNPQSVKNIITGNSVAPITDNLGALYATESPSKRIREDQSDDEALDIERSIFVMLRRALGNNGNDGFDLVIGNPPYFVTARNSAMPLAGTTYGRAIELEYEDIVKGRANIASMFVKRGLEILEPENGILSLILPKPMLYADGYRNLRKYIKGKCNIVEITDIGKAWEEVGYEQVIMFLEPEDREEARKDNTVRVVSGFRDVDYLEYGEYTEHYVSQESFYDHDVFPIYLSNATHPDIEDVWEEMLENSILFGDLQTDVFRGLGIQSKKHILSNSKQGLNWTPILRGRNLGGDKKSTGESWYIDLNGVDYVDTSSNELTDKTKRLENNKIICKRLVSSDVKIDATYDDSASTEPLSYYNYDTITNIVVEDQRVNDLFLLGVLTSKPVTAYLRDVIFARATLTMDLDEPYLAQVPIPDIPKTTDDGSVSQQKIAEIAEFLINTKKQLEKQDYSLESASDGYLDIHSRFNNARRQLNDLCLESYGIYDDESKETLTDVLQYNM